MVDYPNIEVLKHEIPQFNSMEDWLARYNALVTKTKLTNGDLAANLLDRKYAQTMIDCGRDEDGLFAEDLVALEREFKSMETRRNYLLSCRWAYLMRALAAEQIGQEIYDDFAGRIIGDTVDYS